MIKNTQSSNDFDKMYENIENRIKTTNKIMRTNCE